MRQAFRDVLQFHRTMPSHVGTTPAVPDEDTVKFRVRLIREEVKETLDAIEEGSLFEIADGIADSIYVLLGTAIAYGIDLRPVWDAVQIANMAKLGGEKRVDGKCLKPPGWTPPDVAGILARQDSLEYIK